MRVRRLWWAGVEVVGSAGAVVIDPLSDISGAARLGLGTPRTATPAPSPACAAAVLVTHLHPDHFDPVAIRAALGSTGSVFCPIECEETVLRAGLPARGLREFETIPLDDADTSVTALPAVDGFGDPQRSWLITIDGQRLIHAGDTLWHGLWWRIAREYGPIDVAFLPINGPLTRFPSLVESDLPAAMKPEEAAAVATILAAGIAVPIHYDAFHNPPIYEQQPDALRRFINEANRRNVTARVLEPGETLHISLRDAEPAATPPPR